MIIMKTQQLFFLLFTILSFNACQMNSNTEVRPLSTSERLIGSWKLVNLAYSGTSTIANVGTSSFTGIAVNHDFTIEFVAKPSNFITTGNYSIEQTTEFAGLTNIQTIPNPGHIADGIWGYSGDRITLYRTNQTPQQTTITNLTERSFDMTIDIHNVKEESGATIVQNIRAVYSFERY